VRLLVCRRSGGRLIELDRRLHLTRLGQGVDATGRFHPDALARTLAAMADFGAELDELGVRHRRVVATSAARDAANSAEFFAGVRARLGVDAEVIPGEEEARLSYAGALSALPDVAQPVLVMDIGGGSTELVPGSDVGPTRAVSLDVGSVRLRERFLHSDPPVPAEIGAARDQVDALLDSCGIDFASVASWVGVGGRLLELPIAQVVTLPTMVPGRADVICAGALICATVARRVPAELFVSEADILDGIVLGLAG
jgi:exopolyphosphatase/guanosine-5'-triphosphate,3'-diphosphate pyrophosphatase